MATVEIPAATEQIDYGDLYARWEAGNWSATQLDFSQDRIDWHERLTEEQRRGMLWLFTLFFHGEDSVTDNLSPYVDAAPTEEQTYFLATQQVDEARHSVFFHRFVHEVVGLGGPDPGSTLAATADQLTWGHRQVFAHLDDTAAALRRDPSKLQLARAVTLYHVIVEGSLAQPGQHMIEDALERLDVLPGFREGMRRVSMDEQRHIAFGVRLLADLHAEDPGPVSDAILDALREALAWTIAVPMPPSMDRSYTESWGFTLEELTTEGARMNEAKLRAIGLPIDEMPNVPLPMDVPPAERARRGVAMYEAGFIGPRRDGPVPRDPEALELLFTMVASAADPRHVAPGTVVQWDFPDAEPWHLRLDPDGTLAAPGRAPRPTATMRLRFDDWVDIVADRADPIRLLLRGRLRITGNPLTMLRLTRVFG